MPYLFDSNTLLRLAEQNSPERPTVISAIRSLRRQNEILVYTPQVLASSGMYARGRLVLVAACN